MCSTQSAEIGTRSVPPEAVELVWLVEQARSTFLDGGGRHAVRLHLPEDLRRVTSDWQRIVQV
ncbi:MAG: hypothetical protein OXH75_10965 [Acidobacteria bacterium]|nr:hypothetical protein [Acidobacteriota bacterium]